MQVVRIQPQGCGEEAGSTPGLAEAVRSGEERGSAPGAQGLQLRERHGEALGRASRKPTPEASDPGQLLKAGEVVEPEADLP